MAVALMFLVPPTATAKHIPAGSPDDEHGDLSRMFPFLASARIEFKENGTGFYDPANPNDLCIISVLGVQVPVAGVTYYETGRVILNFWKHLLEDTTVQDIDPGLCPDPTAPPLPDYHILYPGANIYTGFYLPQDALLCVKKPFDTCIATAWDWDMYACKPEDAFFGAPAKPEESFFQSLGLPLGSGEIWCNDGTDDKSNITTTEIHHHDVSEKIDGSSNSPGTVSSGFDAVPVDVMAHEGNGDVYVISCLTVNKVQIPPPPALPFNVNTTSHDWILVLDRATTNMWNESLAIHEGNTNNNHGNDGQGFFDLSGQNGCPFDGTECPQENKKPNSPEKEEPGLKTDKNATCGSNPPKGTPIKP